MRGRLYDRWPVLLLPLLFKAGDATLTHLGQPPRAERTASNVNELNPVAALALTSGLGAEVLFHAVWVLVIVLPIALLPRFWAICYSYGWAFGHAAAVMIWLVYPYRLGYWTLYWYCPIVAVLFVLVARRMFGPAAGPAPRGELYS
jgi:hypothetical protein